MCENGLSQTGGNMELKSGGKMIKTRDGQMVDTADYSLYENDNTLIYGLDRDIDENDYQQAVINSLTGKDEWTVLLIQGVLTKCYAIKD